MSRTMSSLLIMLLCLACAGPAWCMAMTQPYGEGRITPIWRDGEMPKDIAELMNFPGRVYGDQGFFSELGQWENLYFQGDSEAFNRFLEQYSKLKLKPLWLVIHVGQPLARAQFGGKLDKEIRYDWDYTRQIPEKKTDPEIVWVDLWLGGRVQFDKIKVPANLELQSGGEIEKFIEAHKAGRMTPRDEEPAKPKPPTEDEKPKVDGEIEGQ